MRFTYEVIGEAIPRPQKNDVIEDPETRYPYAVMSASRGYAYCRQIMPDGSLKKTTVNYPIPIAALTLTKRARPVTWEWYGKRSARVWQYDPNFLGESRVPTPKEAEDTVYAWLDDAPIGLPLSAIQSKMANTFRRGEVTADEAAEIAARAVKGLVASGDAVKRGERYALA